MTRAATRSLITEAAGELTRAGVASARHDAEALAAHVLGVPRTRLHLRADALDGVRERYLELISRRAGREPLQHITGRAAFRHLEIAVGPGVLIPRPETELLIDAASDWLRDHPLPAGRGPRVVDLGTGTGVLALAAAQEWPRAQVWAVERDAAALAWAARNIAATGLPVSLVEGDLTAALADLDGTVDIVLSNPPYLPLTLASRLEPEVRDHDPAPALFAGADGLATIRQVAAAAARLLAPGGLAVVEHGEDQGSSAPECFAAPAWSSVTDHRDLAGRPRYLTAVRT
jgi:release factor glutamine methyltransferase